MSNFYFNVNPGNTNARLFVGMENRRIPWQWFFNASIFCIIWCLVISKSTAERVMLGAAAALGLSRGRRRVGGGLSTSSSFLSSITSWGRGSLPAPAQLARGHRADLFSKYKSNIAAKQKEIKKQKLQFTDRQTGPSWWYNTSTQQCSPTSILINY